MPISIARIIARPWLWLSLSLLITLTLGAGFQHFSLTNSYKVYFDEDFPPLLAIEAIEADYTTNDNVLFVLTPRDGQLFSRNTLDAVEWLTEESWQIPYATRVDSMSNFQHIRAEGDDLVVEDLVSEARSLSDGDLENISRIARDEPRLVNYLVSDDAPVTGINVTLHLPGEDRIAEDNEVIAHADDLAERFNQRYPGIELRQSGLVVMNTYFSSVARDDTASILPILFAAVFFGLWLFLRSLMASVATMVVITLSIVSALGLFAWLGLEFSPPTLGAPLMILTLAVAHCVHILVTYLDELPSKRRPDRAAAMAEAMRINRSPIFITSITTFMGFLSMNFSDSPPFRELGNLVAAGVFFSWIYSVVALPALAQWLPMRPHPRRDHTSGAMVALANGVIRHRRWLTVVFILVAAVISSFATQNRLDDTYAHYFDETIEFRQNADYTDANLTGIFPLNFAFETGQSNGISDPDFLAFIARYSEWLRAQPETGFVSTYSDTVKQLNQSMHGDDPAYYHIPESQPLAAQYLLMYEMSLPYGLDLTNQINMDKSGSRVFANMHISSTQTVSDFKDRSEAWLERNMPGDIAVRIGATPYMFARLGQENVRSLVVGAILALVGISMVLIFALRSFKIGLISLVPNILPALMAFGIWGMLVGRVGLSLAVVLGMTMGIVVDDTVHLLSKYLRARRERGYSPADSLRYSFSTVGTALWVTSTVLVAGFGAFALSHYEPNASMGVMTAMTIAMALVCDFLLLPVLLLLVDRQPSQ
ncbi:MAG: efflux RND transporter permease subunit [Pseudomonadota bacterium]